MPFVLHSDVADGGNGAASNCHDFIVNKLIPFATSSNHFPAAADRWTLERTDNVGTNEVEAFLSPPSNAPNAPVIAFHTRDSAAFMFAGTSYVAGTASYALPGNTRQFPGETLSELNPEWDPTIDPNSKACSWTNNWPTTGLTGHWLMAPSNGSYIYAVIQLAARRFRHIMFGEYNKDQASMTGGQFFGAMFWDSTGVGGGGNALTPFASQRNMSSPIIGLSANGGSGRQMAMFRAVGLRSGAVSHPNVEWYGTGLGSPTSPNNLPATWTRPVTGSWDTANNTGISVHRGSSNCLGVGAGNMLHYVQTSLIAGVRPPLEIPIWALGHADGQDRVMQVGRYPDLFRWNMSRFVPGQEINAGSNTYVVFPIANSDQVNTQSDEEYSGFDGFAVLKRT